MLLKKLWPREKKKKVEPTVDLAALAGNWVAIAGSRVVAVSPSPSELIDKLKAMRQPATIHYEARPEDVKLWAVMSKDGRICPNCYFDTEREARVWQKFLEDDRFVVTRDGQHDAWRPVEEVPQEAAEEA